jgi:ABC-type oligopeptide transport system substrate-binding subunit
MTRFVAIGLSAAAAALLLVGAGGAGSVREGGTFLVAVLGGRVDTIDPALVDFLPELQLLDPACGTLVAYPDRPLPAGARLTPSLAERDPVVSRNGLTYTFTIREDARFSDGAQVTARAFSRALERALSPVMRSNLAFAFEDVVGAPDVLAGRATRPRGVVARGRTLVLSLTRRVPDFLDRMANLCAVPPLLPVDPEGAKAPLPSAAPYFVAQYLPGERLVLERNRFYRGERPQHVAKFVADLAVDAGVAANEVARGRFDTLVPPNVVERAPELARRYGVNRARFFVEPGAGLRVFHLNTSGPLFRKNPKLRQAVNLAVDRRALVREIGSLLEQPTDQYLLPGIPGYRNERIYPLDGDLPRARALARGHTRSGKALLYTTDQPQDLAQAQSVQRSLQAIGLAVEIKPFPVPLFFDAIAREGEPYDLARLRWTPTPPWRDPSYLDELFTDLSHFDPPLYRRLLDEASRLTGQARYQAFGELDVRLARDAAPAIPVAVFNALAFVSARTGCVVMNPNLDLTAVCLR